METGSLIGLAKNGGKLNFSFPYLDVVCMVVNLISGHFSRSMENHVSKLRNITQDIDLLHSVELEPYLSVIEACECVKANISSKSILILALRLLAADLYFNSCMFA